MMEHLDRTMNEVKSRHRIAQILHIVIYLIFWTACFVWYCVADRSEYGFAPAFALMTFYAILPILSFVISLLIGKDGRCHLAFLTLCQE